MMSDKDDAYFDASSKFSCIRLSMWPKFAMYSSSPAFCAYLNALSMSRVYAQQIALHYCPLKNGQG